MYKYPVTILLILLIALQTFSKWCVIVDYQVNKEYIAKNLCVNRFRPSCCCHGKCYLNKKMAADESQQQAPGKGSQKDEVLLQVHTPGNALPEPAISLVHTTHSTRYLSGLSRVFLSSFTPPPDTGLPSERNT